MPKEKNTVIAQSERLYLTFMTVEDAPAFAKWYNDPDCFGHSRDMAYQTTVEEQTRWIQATNQDPTMKVYSVYYLPDDCLIGDGGFMHFDVANRTAEIGYVIGEKQYWRMGLGKELRWLLCKFGFESLGLHNILGEHYATNPISLHNALKTGSRLIGTRRESRFINGKHIDVHYTDMLAHELIKPPLKPQT